MIRAGSKNKINPNEDWIILDIGFSSKTKSCGLLINDELPIEVTYSEATKKIVSFLESDNSNANLVIEAPLSVAFDVNGNPKGRKIEKNSKQVRYWYLGLGCQVMVASLYLLNEINKKTTSKDINLYEGFVSFKDKKTTTNHLKDVLILRKIIDSPNLRQSNIFEENALKFDDTDQLQSALLVTGIDTGIPPVIMNIG